MGLGFGLFFYKKKVVHGISFEILWIQFFPCRFVGCPPTTPFTVLG